MSDLVTPDGQLAHTGAIPAGATPANCPLEPTPGNVVIVRESPPQVRRKVHVPEAIQDRMRGLMAEARVMAVGGPELHMSGVLVEAPCKVGDRVLTAGVSSFGTHKAEGSEVVWEVLPYNAITSTVKEGSESGIPEFRGIPG